MLGFTWLSGTNLTFGIDVNVIATEKLNKMFLGQVQKFLLLTDLRKIDFYKA